MAIMDKKGRIIKQVSNDYSIALEEEIVVCKARGKFRNMGLSPLVGDFVSIDYENRYILEIEKRKMISLLSKDIFWEKTETYTLVVPILNDNKNQKPF